MLFTESSYLYIMSVLGIFYYEYYGYEYIFYKESFCPSLTGDSFD